MARPRKYKAYELEELIFGEKGYFNWIKENPFYKYDVVKTGERAGEELKIKVERMPTIEGICTKLRIDRQTWYNWLNEAGTINPDEEIKKGDEGEENVKFFDIVTHATNEIQDEQISGAGSGLYQPMIAARLNKLKDTAEVTTTNIDATNKTEDEIRAAIQAIQAARNK